MSLTFVSLDARSSKYDETLLKMAKDIERQLFSRYSLINSVYFESICLGIAKEFNIKNLKSCRLIQAPYDNAYALANGQVYITVPLLKKTRNIHQLAHILAHEWAHLALQHHVKLADKYANPGFFFPKSAIKKMRKKHELEADIWAEKKLLEHRYQIEQIDFLFSRIQKNNPHNYQLKSRHTNKDLKKEVHDPEWIQFLNKL